MSATQTLLAFPGNETIQAKFDAWIETPSGKMVAYWLIRMAYHLRNRGVQHFSMRDAIGICRYRLALRLEPDDEGFKINNNYSSRLIRWIEQKKPDLEGFYIKKTLKRE